MVRRKRKDSSLSNYIVDGLIPIAGVASFASGWATTPPNYSGKERASEALAAVDNLGFLNSVVTD